MPEPRISQVKSYLRLKALPTLWCPGCGIGLVASAIIRAVIKLSIKKDDIAFITGIGCTGRMSGYMDFNTIHTTHGRALAFASGLKLARPDLTVIVVMGDGDALAIGGNHFIHACRRNLDITAIVVNNSTYGMTGGQVSPLTPRGEKAVTAPYGSIEPAFDVTKLAEAAGASFVARSTTYHMVEAEKLIMKGIEKKGASVIELMAQCPVYYGRLTGKGGPASMLLGYRESAKGKEGIRIERGVLVDKELPEYGQNYRNLVAGLKED